SSRRRHTRFSRDWSSDVCSSDLSLVSQADNIDARILGGELGVAYDLSDTWKTDATLAYAWGKNSSDGEALPQMPPLEARLGLTRSEERRVGKECRARWGADHANK